MRSIMRPAAEDCTTVRVRLPAYGLAATRDGRLLLARRNEALILERRRDGRDWQAVRLTRWRR